MKKILTFITGTIFLLSGKGFAQDDLVPEPTTASLQNYINTGVSPSTGVPSISIPLYSLESSDSNIPVNISLSYHPHNAVATVPASEVGLGWSIFKGAMITKESGAQNNETLNINDLNNTTADLFYYNIPGHSGKFKIYKDPATNTLRVFELSGNKVIIEFVRDTTNPKLVFNSFKITDDKGYQYNFQDYNFSLFRDKTTFEYINPRTAFNITEVKDASNKTIISYSYSIKTKNLGTSSTVKYKLCKLQTISTSKGKLFFDYTYDAGMENRNDSNNDYYTINTITLKSNAGVVKSSYQFGWGSVSTWVNEWSFGMPNVTLGSKNVISWLKKLDQNNAVFETTEFDYSTASETIYEPSPFGNAFCNNEENTIIYPANYSKGILKTIKFPTGGMVKYDFEANETYLDKTTRDYSTDNIFSDPLIQYYGVNNTININTNLSRNYTFSINGTGITKYPVRFDIGNNWEDDMLSNPHGIPYLFTYTITKANSSTAETLDSYCGSYNLSPGQYTLKVNTNWGGRGDLHLKTLKALPKPYKNYQTVKAGSRIKQITYSENGNILKQKNFSYNSFTDQNSSSGYLYAENGGISTSDWDGTVIYKNVREAEVSGAQNNGYIDYYYKTPDDYQYTTTNGIICYPSTTSNGVLDKRITYNTQGQIQDIAIYEYTMVEMAGAAAATETLSFVPSFIQYTKETATTKRGSTDFVTISEVNYSPNNFQQISSKVTTHNGDIEETTTKYAQDLSDTRLINANMISVPLETTVKENGNILSTSKTLFANTGHFYPTSVVATDLAQNPETQMTFDLYDENGNLVQMTNKAGISTTTIWGYHKTLPIAQIVGAKYSDISSLSVIASAVAASDSDADNGANEAALLTALNNLRLNSSLQQYPITVYTYDPLVGITNSISANGIKVTYTYDASGRLSTVKDSNGKVLKENQYNYKH